jgi:hypothetical protein
VAVSPEHESAFLDAMKGHPTTVLGQVQSDTRLVITDADDALIAADVETLVEAWKGTLDLTGGVA